MPGSHNKTNQNKPMKTLTLAPILLLCCGLACPAQTQADKQAVRDMIRKLDDIWNAHDYHNKAAYEVYEKDAVMINPVGMHWRGRAEIMQARQVFGELMLRHISAESRPLQIRFLAPSVAQATVRVRYQIEHNYELPKGKRAGSQGEVYYSIISAVLTKTGDMWRVALLQETNLNPETLKFDPVKQAVN